VPLLGVEGTKLSGGECQTHFFLGSRGFRILSILLREKITRGFYREYQNRRAMISLVIFVLGVIVLGSVAKELTQDEKKEVLAHSFVLECKFH